MATSMRRIGKLYIPRTRQGWSLWLSESDLSNMGHILLMTFSNIIQKRHLTITFFPRKITYFFILLIVELTLEKLFESQKKNSSKTTFSLHQDEDITVSFYKKKSICILLLLLFFEIIEVLSKSWTVVYNYFIPNYTDLFSDMRTHRCV